MPFIWINFSGLVLAEQLVLPLDSENYCSSLEEVLAIWSLAWVGPCCANRRFADFRAGTSAPANLILVGSGAASTTQFSRSFPLAQHLGSGDLNFAVIIPWAGVLVGIPIFARSEWILVTQGLVGPSLHIRSLAYQAVMLDFHDFVFWSNFVYCTNQE